MEFKQFYTGEEESVSSSYLSLSGHDSGVTRRSSMSYVSVDGTGTLSDISSGYLSVDVNQDSKHDDSEYDESSNSGNKCFSCFLDGMESLATHTCYTCRPEKKFLCHKCLRQHNKFCDGHDVISLSVKNEQHIAPFNNPSDKNAENGLIKSYDQAIPLKATSFQIPITELSKKGKRQDSAKDTFHEICTEDHKKYSIYQQSNSSKQSVQSHVDVALTAKRSSHQKKDSAVRNKNIRNQSHSQKVPKLEQKYRYRFTVSELGLKGLNEVKHVTDSAEQKPIPKTASMQANSYRLSSAQISTEISELFNNKKEDGRIIKLPSAKITFVLTYYPGYIIIVHNCIYNGYIWSYTFIFPSDCRMFLYVPVYTKDYIHRTESAKNKIL